MDCWIIKKEQQRRQTKNEGDKKKIWRILHFCIEGLHRERMVGSIVLVVLRW